MYFLLFTCNYWCDYFDQDLDGPWLGIHVFYPLDTTKGKGEVHLLDIFVWRSLVCFLQCIFSANNLLGKVGKVFFYGKVCLGLCSVLEMTSLGTSCYSRHVYNSLSVFVCMLKEDGNSHELFLLFITDSEFIFSHLSIWRFDLRLTLVDRYIFSTLVQKEGSYHPMVTAFPHVQLCHPRQKQLHRAHRKL